MDRAPPTCWRSRSPAETRALGRGLAAALGAGGGVVSLVGALGAGKTEFAKGLAEGLGLDPETLASPTFTIAHELPLAGAAGRPDPAAGRPDPAAGRPDRLVHADFFRLESRAELDASGLDDWLAPGIALAVEWGDRFPGALGAETLEVRLEESEDGSRVVSATACGAGPAAVLARWRERCP